jgi:hypothetical protein
MLDYIFFDTTLSGKFKDHLNEAKERLKPHLDEGNVEKSMTAPVVAIIGYDTEFYEKLPFLFPHTDAKS